MNPTGNHAESAAGTDLGATITLPEFLTRTSDLTLEERQRIVDQLFLLLKAT